MNMNNGLKSFLAVSLSVAMLPLTLRAEDKPAAAEAPKDSAKDSGMDQKQKVSYGVGMTFGNQIKRAGFEVDVPTVAAAIQDVLAGHELKLTDKEAREAIGAYQKEVMAKREEERKKTAEKNKKEGEKFLAENKTKEGIKTHGVKLQDGSMAEMQYKIISEGTGAIPRSNDMVSVVYRGTLINGTEFDSSAKHGGQPGKFNVSRVVKGWTEALQMMKVGSKWQLFLPSTLAYGDFPGPGGGIEPGSTLIFDMELVNIEAPPAPATPPQSQPLTSDIIRVPSKEELDKGAKIEVLKPEEAAKRAQEEAAKKAQESTPKK
jgi:FKBP-type peptidyl-prolyl cis-trans isomerase FklB